MTPPITINGSSQFGSLIEKKIQSVADIVKTVAQLRITSGRKIIFTNGCFDLLHQGHLHVLHHAKSLGGFLIVGLNTDRSVSELKPGRPIQKESSRSALLAALEAVDAVVLFDEQTPIELITFIKPDIIVKGGDYNPEDVVGKNVLDTYGGKIVIVPLLNGYSTTNIISEMKNNK